MKRIKLLVFFVFPGLFFACATQAYPIDETIATTTTQTTTSLDLPHPQLTIEQVQDIVLQGQSLETEIEFSMEGMLDFEYPRTFNGIEGYFRVQRESGFSSVADIRNALLRHYTEEMTDRLMLGNDGERYSPDFPIYVEFDGNLYFRTVMGAPMYLVWAEASFTLLESDGERNTYRVLVRELDSEVSHAVYEITFIGERIHSRQWIAFELIE